MSKISHARHFSKRQSAALNAGCSNGAFYKSPKQGDAIDTSQPINIAWDTSLDCFSSQGVDIYLYAPYAEKSMIHAWGAVSYSAGSFQTDLVGSWWNSTTAPIELQLGFVESGTPAFLSSVPPGPIFSSTFNATDFGIKNPTGGSNATATGSSASSGGGIFQTIGNAYRNSGLPKGNIAAAVLVPLLAVGVAIAVYVKFQRKKEAEKRKRWSQAVDKRMSTISTEWKGVPPQAQSEAIRQSIAIMRNSRASMARMSQLYDADGEIRPVSVVSSVNSPGAAGVGVGTRKGTGVGLRNPNMSASQLSLNSTNRKSKISFAADTRFSRPSLDVPDVPDLPKAVPRPSMDRSRPSGDTQRSHASRAFHTAINASDSDDVDVLMSPKQKGGPQLVDDTHIHQLELGNDESVLPALNMIHHDNGSSEFLFLGQPPIASPPATRLSPTSATPFNNHTPYSPSYANYPSTTSSFSPITPITPSPSSPDLTYTSAQAPAPPVPVIQAQAPSQTNPFSGFTRGPSTMMSPDAMLRAYAKRDGSIKGTPMAVNPSVSGSVKRSSSSASSLRSLKSSLKSGRSGPKGEMRSAYSSFDAPAQPERVGVDMDLVPGPPPPASNAYGAYGRY
ncbi:hypothetical protein K439DRAFT_860402 [Ramaria rubella]|nr:hypothetical protein K439DRAFT_860402 [Ramaria rubella]